RVQIVTLNIEAVGSGGAASRLEELSSLRERQLITEDEYTRKREEILRAL
ncbi:MAG: SHOCT domain-containing protein, partial [Chloroflexi bacterium]|nr:SHOCT domain-containing protein [Chloroflexota bacterium]